ncbi:MAG TPA: hypothetical protein VMT85_22075 [Thermoanaerobaculia bacterium]|nr:hypothetical protein [Thermoanaerobaculia bacterium]
MSSPLSTCATLRRTALLLFATSLAAGAASPAVARPPAPPPDSVLGLATAQSGAARGLQRPSRGVRPQVARPPAASDAPAGALQPPGFQTGFGPAGGGGPSGGPSGPDAPGGPSGPGGPGGPAGPGGPDGGPSGGPSGPSGGDGSPEGIPSGGPFFGPAFQPWGGDCGGSIEDVVTVTGLDLSARGISLRFPGSELDLESLSARTQCLPAPGFTAQSRVLEPVLAVDRSYRSEDDEWLWLSQYPSSQRTVDAIYPYGATFWIDGTTYVYWAWAPHFFQGGPSADDDPTSRLVEQVLEDLAPELDRACFYRQTSGGFEDLAALGIGDPRPAIPSPFQESSVYLQYFEAPPAACGALQIDMPVHFGASFVAGGSYFGVWAQSRYDGGGVQGLGTQFDNSMWWLGERYQYSVYGWDASGGSATADIVRIATTVDPELDVDCLRRPTQLGADDLTRLGLPSATPPAGFTTQYGAFHAELVPETCKSLDPISSRTFNLYWSFQDAATQRNLSANATRDPLYQTWGLHEPWVSDGTIWWQKDDGTSFYVSGYDGEGQPLTQELLLEVALSLDPDFELP